MTPENCRGSWATEHQRHLLPAPGLRCEAVMQTVWSRAGQARCLCNCPACTSVTAATTRRTTTATARRGIRRGDVYTVFASSLAATAALVDSRNKDLRSEQWKRVIAEVRAQVQATEEEQQARLASLLRAKEDEPVKHFEPADRKKFPHFIKQKIKGSWRQIRPYSYVDSWTSAFRWAAHEEAERATAGFRDVMGPSLALLRSLSLAELDKLLTDQRRLRRFHVGPTCAALVDTRSKHRLSEKKLKTLEWSIAKLVHKLLFYSSASPQPAENKVELPMQVPSHAIDHLLPPSPAVQVKARADYTPQLEATIPREEPVPRRGSDIKDSAEKNEQPHSVIYGQSLEDRLAQIDAQIISLRVGGPEGITHRNSAYYKNFESPPLPKYKGNMLYDFDEAKALNNSLKSLLDPMKCTDDLDTVISKIGYNLIISWTPPNVHTYNMLLVRFCHLDNYKMFRAVLTSMRESHIWPDELTHSTVLRYFTSTNKGYYFTQYVLRMEGHLEDVALANPSEELSSTTSQRFRTLSHGGEKKKIAEKARMNGEVYEALITGALRFFGPQCAMQYYRDMISEGWRAGIDMLIAILKSCYRRCDWDSGVSVWHQIRATSDQADSRAFQWMLCLCQACGQHDAFYRIIQDGVRAGALPASMLSRSNGAKYQSLDSPCKATETLVDKFTSESPAISWVKKHVRNRVVANTTDDPEERPVARTVLADSIDSTSIPWVENHKRRGMTQSKCKYEDPVLAKEQWQKPRAVYTKAEDSGIRLTVVHGLAGKVKELNEIDSQKMNDKEYNEYRYKRPGRFEKNRQLISRWTFEKYRKSIVARLEREDQQGQTYHEPAPFTMLNLAYYVPTPGSLSSDDEYMSTLVYCKPSASTKVQNSRPLSKKEQGNQPFEVVVPESSSLSDDHTSHASYETSILPMTYHTPNLSSSPALKNISSDVLADTDRTSHLTPLVI